MPIHIPVEQISVERPVTIQRGYFEFVMEDCSHAGAEDVEICLDPGGEFEKIVTAPECDKCHAIQNIVGEWE